MQLSASKTEQHRGKPNGSSWRSSSIVTPALCPPSWARSPPPERLARRPEKFGAHRDEERVATCPLQAASQRLSCHSLLTTYNPNLPDSDPTRPESFTPTTPSGSNLATVGFPAGQQQPSLRMKCCFASVPDLRVEWHCIPGISITFGHFEGVKGLGEASAQGRLPRARTCQLCSGTCGWRRAAGFRGSASCLRGYQLLRQEERRVERDHRGVMSLLSGVRSGWQNGWPGVCFRIAIGAGCDALQRNVDNSRGASYLWVVEDPLLCGAAQG
jgi:hypothetical protein